MLKPTRRTTVVLAPPPDGGCLSFEEERAFKRAQMRMYAGVAARARAMRDASLHVIGENAPPPSPERVSRTRAWLDLVVRDGIDNN